MMNVRGTLIMINFILNLFVAIIKIIVMFKTFFLGNRLFAKLEF